MVDKLLTRTEFLGPFLRLFSERELRSSKKCFSPRNRETSFSWIPVSAARTHVWGSAICYRVIDKGPASDSLELMLK
jgi:hypothetical protein